MATNPSPPAGPIRALLFDTFGTVVDWRGSLLADLAAFGERRGITADWTRLTDDWRAAYAPSMDRVRRGELPWQTLDGLHRASLERLAAEQGIAGLTEDDLAYLTRAWHRLRPWPDAVAGLTRLKTKFLIAPLSNGNVSLLANMAKAAGLPWDVVFGSDVFRHFKPDPETYLGACRLLDLQPEQVMMTAAHNSDLAAAQRLGLATAFIPRPTEYGPRQTKDYGPEGEWTVVARDLEDLAERLGA